MSFHGGRGERVFGRCGHFNSPAANRDRCNLRQLRGMSPPGCGFTMTVVWEWQPNGEFVPFDNCPM